MNHLYTIYDHPSDHPDSFVIKRWNVDLNDGAVQDPDYLVVQESVKECRVILAHMGLYNLGRMENDDPVIVESWI